MSGDAAGKSRLERVTRKIHAKLNDPSVIYLFGRKRLKEHQDARRICYVRDGGNVVPPRQTGAEKISDGRYRIAMCRTRAENCIAYLYAENDELADDLLDSLIAAICEVDPGAQFARYASLSDEPNEASDLLRSYAYVVPFVMRLPVPSSIKPLRVVATIDHECGKVDGDGNVVPLDENGVVIP